jgi:hypothetical protein
VVKRLGGGGVSEDVCCDVCGRVLLKGEPLVLFLAPKGYRRRKPGERERRWVCELCSPYAQDEGWNPRPEPSRRKLLRPAKQEKQLEPPKAPSLPARKRRDDA